MPEHDQSFVRQEIGGFQVIRDDLYEGGTKRRAFKNLIGNIKETELVYACDYFGYAAYAIALTARDAMKKVMLFYPHPVKQTDVFKKTNDLPNVQHQLVREAFTQMEANPYAQQYAASNGARYLPVGLDFADFGTELEKVVRSANIHAPEIWCLGGSGTLGRALQRAYPNIPVKIVNLGTADFNGGTNNTIYNAPEKWDDPAEIIPPYPSTPYPDAKVWRFVQIHARPGACIWNVA